MKHPVHLPRWKSVTLAVLAAAAVFFLAVEPSSVRSGSRRGPVDTERIRAAVDRLLREAGVPPAQVKTWKVKVQGSPFTRVEQRVQAPADFVSLLTNHTLDSRLAPLGAHVVATERTIDATVTMHIVTGGRTVHSIAFISNP